MSAVVAVSRCSNCGELSALTEELGRLVACRVFPGGLWWCECSPETWLYRPRPMHCCPHLRAVGMTSAREVQ